MQKPEKIDTNNAKKYLIKINYLFVLALMILIQSCQNPKVETQFTSKEDSTSVRNQKINNQPIQETGKYKIAVEQIDSLYYHSQKVKYAYNQDQIKKITNYSVAKKLLAGIVEFDESIEDNPMVKKINFINSKQPNQAKTIEPFESYFIAYYPSENILLCEGGHSTDVSYNLKTGEETDDTGNPDYINTSKNKLFRLNGNFDGQDCSSYFIQRKIDNHYKKVIQLDSEFEKQTKIWLCKIGSSFWQDNNFLYLTEESNYTENGLIKRYFKVKIIQP